MAPGHSRCHNALTHKSLTSGQGALEVEADWPNTLTTGQGFDEQAHARRILAFFSRRFQVLPRRA
jgi:hypothetical protein